MNKAFDNFTWENYPSKNTALEANRLNGINRAIDTIDDRVIKMDTAKLDKATANTMVQNVEFNETTGIFTITKLNGSKLQIDTKLEKIIVNFRFDEVLQRLIITLDDGTVQYVDISALIAQYEFINSDTITFTLGTNGRITATVNNGSITGDMLEPNYLAHIKLSEEQTKAYAEQAKTKAEDCGIYAEQAKANAELADKNANSVSGTVDIINKKLELASFSINNNGHLIYTDNTSYSFQLVDGRLTYTFNQ